MNDIVIDPATDNLFIARDNRENDADLDPQYSIGRILKSSDRGVSWTDISSSLPAGRSVLALDTTRPENARVLYSTGGGTTWQKVLDQPRVGLVLVHPGDPEVIFAASQPWWNFSAGLQAGFYRSSDRGDTWEQVNNDLGHTFVLSGVINPHNPEQILVGTHGGGVWLGDTQTSTPLTLVGDFNSNGTVDFTDFLEFAANFGKTQESPGFNSKHDLNGDGSVNFPDFLQFVARFGQST